MPVEVSAQVRSELFQLIPAKIVGLINSPTDEQPMNAAILPGIVR